MQIDRDTALFMSFSQTPGNSGSKAYNYCFKEYGINAVYIARKALSPKDTIDVIRKLELRGASISMPLKQAVIPLLDELSSEAKEIGSVNTILNRDGKLIGHNTDAWGFFKTIESVSVTTATVYGAGGVVPSILWALKKKGVNPQNISVAGRNRERIQRFAEEHGLSSTPLPHFDLLVNATPSGTSGQDEVVALAERSGFIADLAASGVPDTFRAVARTKGIRTVGGDVMFKYQFQKQFELHFGIVVPMTTIDRALA